MKNKNILIIIGIIILITIIISLNLNLKSKINLSEQYYQYGTIKDITKEELLTKINNKENFILFTNNNFCTFKISCEEIFKESAQELNITILKIPFDEFKTTKLHDTIKFAPSVIIIKDGKIIEYLDPEKNDDLSKYQDKKEFISWIKEYINI